MVVFSLTPRNVKFLGELEVLLVPVPELHPASAVTSALAAATPMSHRRPDRVDWYTVPP
jgi:hypothetical protein